MPPAPSVKDQVTDAVNLVGKHALKHGTVLAQECIDAAQPVLTWIEWYHNCRPKSYAVELLGGARASVVETVAYVSMGLGRAALTAVRTQVDQMLSFSYFREHPAEWKLVCSIGDGYRLRSEILKYHKEMDPGPGGFGDRLAMIDQVNKPTLEECYRTISAHVHGQSPTTIAKVGTIPEVLSTSQILADVVKIQKQCSAALSAYLLTVHAREWNELPVDVVQWGKKLLKPAQQPLFFVGK